MARVAWRRLGLAVVVATLAACAPGTTTPSVPLSQGSFALGTPAPPTGAVPSGPEAGPAGPTARAGGPDGAASAPSGGAAMAPSDVLGSLAVPAGAESVLGALRPPDGPSPPIVLPRASGGSGGGSSGGGFVAPPTTPAPTPPVLAPVTFNGTMGNPADPLKIDGVRLDPDFATNGKLHLAFSVIDAGGRDLSTRVDPAKVRAVLSFADAPPTVPAGGAPAQPGGGTPPTSTPTSTPTPTATATAAPTASPAPTASASPGPYRLLDLTGLAVQVDAIPGQGRPPLDVVLVIDSTGSMANTDPQRLRVAGGRSFVDQIRPSDEIAVVDFAMGLPTDGAVADPTFDGIPNIRLLHAFSKDRDAAKAGVDLVREEGGTNLYDALDRAIRYLAARSGNRPRGVVALTDGQDNSSAPGNTLESVTAAARDNDVLLMLLAFAAYDASAMNGLASGSGGWFVGAEDPSTLEAQYGAAVRTLGGNAQAILYVPQDQRIAKHMAGRLTVTIDGLDYSGTFNVQQPGP